MKIMVTILGLCASLILISCGSDSDSLKTNMEKSTSATSPVFDVPSLIGLNIDEIRAKLGKPSDNAPEPTKLQLKKIQEWNNSFDKERYTLLITFNPHTREVIDFFMGTTDSTGASSEYKDILALCHVTEQNRNLTIEPVRSVKDESKYTGVKLIPTLRKNEY